MRDKTKVLIVDDNKDFCQLLGEFLAKRADMQVVGVGHNGDEALRLMQSLRPHVCVLDIIMPHLDGIGVLERMASLPEKERPKTIMLTAIGQEHRRGKPTNSEFIAKVADRLRLERAV